MRLPTEIRDRAIVQQWIAQGCSNITRATEIVSPHLAYDSAKAQGYRSFTRAYRNGLLMAELSKIMDASEVKELFTEFARDKSEDTRNRIKAAELMSRVHGLLIDKSEVKTTQVNADVEAEIRKRAAEEALRAVNEPEKPVEGSEGKTE